MSLDRKSEAGPGHGRGGFPLDVFCCVVLFAGSANKRLVWRGMCGFGFDRHGPEAREGFGVCHLGFGM